MSKFYDNLIWNEFSRRNKLTRERYLDAKKRLPEAEFEKHYETDSTNIKYFRHIIESDIPNDDEISEYIQYEKLKAIRKIRDDINVIKAIIIFAFIISLLAGVSVVVGLI